MSARPNWRTLMVLQALLIHEHSNSSGQLWPVPVLLGSPEQRQQVLDDAQQLTQGRWRWTHRAWGQAGAPGSNWQTPRNTEREGTITVTQHCPVFRSRPSPGLLERADAVIMGELAAEVHHPSQPHLFTGEQLSLKHALINPVWFQRRLRPIPLWCVTEQQAVDECQLFWLGGDYLSPCEEDRQAAWSGYERARRSMLIRRHHPLETDLERILERARPDLRLQN